MIRHLGRWAVPAAVLSAALVVSACSGGNYSPSGPSGQSAPVGAQHVSQAKHLTLIGVQPNKKCPKKFDVGCFTVSRSTGLTLTWCYGTASDPCGQTSSITDWNGNVCKAKTPSPCGPIKTMTAAWTGPFDCSPSQCDGDGGTYEVDTISIGKKAPKQTTKYLYKQDLAGCIGSSCGVLGDIGINVGP